MGHYADGFIQLNSPPELASLPSVAARLHCWSIPGFSKIIFLDTDCIVSSTTLQGIDSAHFYFVKSSFARTVYPVGLTHSKPCSPHFPLLQLFPL